MEHLIYRQEVKLRLAVLVIRRGWLLHSALLALIWPLLRLLRSQSLDVLEALVELLLQYRRLRPELFGHFPVPFQQLVILFLDSLQLLNQYPVFLSLQIFVHVRTLLIQRPLQHLDPVLQRKLLLGASLDPLILLFNLLAQLLDRVLHLPLPLHGLALQLLQLGYLLLLLLKPVSEACRVLAVVVLGLQFSNEGFNLGALDSIFFLERAYLLVLGLEARGCLLDGVGQFADLLVFLAEDMEYLLVFLLLLLAFLAQAQAHDLLQVGLLLSQE